MKRKSSSSLLCLLSLFQSPKFNVYYQNNFALVNGFSIKSRNAPSPLRPSLGRTVGRRSLHSSLPLASSTITSSTTPTSPSDDNDYLDPNFFLHQVETTVHNVLSQCPDDDSHQSQKEFLLTLDGPQRESFGVAQNLHQRLVGLRKNDDCPRCWMQRAHCICQDTPPLPHFKLPQLDRIFLILHHKEIAMKVDTAKLILAAFPQKCRLVVAGIGPEYQASMKELQEAMDGGVARNNNCLVLFPDQNAQSIQDILIQDYGQQPSPQSNDDDYDDTSQYPTGIDTTSYRPYDLIVLDGTWAQARKIHTKYIAPMEQGGPRRVQLSESAVETLQEANDQSGHQLRRHTVAWRQVGTYEATRLFWKDLEEALPAELFSSSYKDVQPVWKQISNYQSIANEAARRELGPPRESQKERS